MSAQQRQQQQQEQQALRIFVRQPFTQTSSKDQTTTIQGALDALKKVRDDANLEFLMSVEAESSDTFNKNFVKDYGLPFTPLNFRNLRLRLLSIADAMFVVRTSLSESGSYEVAFNVEARLGYVVPMFFAIHESCPFTTTLLRELGEKCKGVPVRYVTFSDPATLVPELKEFFSDCRGYLAGIAGQRKLPRTIPRRALPAPGPQRNGVLAQFPVDNIDVAGTRYAHRFSGSAQDGADIRDSLPRAKLYLKDGLIMEGYTFGAPISRNGEVVFNTCMTGYVESLSDPSYRGQILVCSSTLQGNYGVPEFVRDRYSLLKHFESEDVHIAGLVVTDYAWNYSHWQAVQSLSQLLQEYNVPAIYGCTVDTRELVQHLRDNGSQLGKIVQDGDDAEALPFDDPNQRNLSAEVSVRGPVDFEGGDIRIVLMDFGVKQSIIRCLLDRGVSVRVVPWNWDLSLEKFDGLMLSNGPGDPGHMDEAVKQIQSVIESNDPIPVFGVCMGNQLMGRAVGAETYKMRFGNRGHNQPVVDLTTGKCYVTSQNHGYAIDAATLPWDWEQLFLNLNDHSNEGIRHKSKPFFSAQFHPEACGGPLDTRFLFDLFISSVVQRKFVAPRNQSPRVKLLQLAQLSNRVRPGEEMMTHESKQTNLTSSSYMLSFRPDLVKVKKVLVLGSGALSIGQAGEFDYSGCQAINALREEGITSILVNPNIATVQTGVTDMADKTYLVPLTVDAVVEIIEKERPDGIFLSFGGQTALNLGVKLKYLGVFDKYNVRVLGTPVESIEATEDRAIFNRKLNEISEPIALSRSANTVEEALNVANSIVGYPVIARAAYALGGLGSGFAENDAELRKLCAVAFTTSDQVLVERDLRGWKELEYEVVRDAYDNCIVVAALENFNPMGIHTGESIVVAPLQTISDEEHFRMRAKAIKIIRHLGVIGECNIQFALNPTSKEIVIIEVNARLSRSSALASKATGYPLAFVAAKLALGHPLPIVANNITKATTAFFEPSLDYVVIKIPRWDLLKFSRVSRKLGSAMKSVGEVMAIGRTFEEALQKGMRMVNSNVLGFEPSPEELARQEFDDPAKRDEELKRATDRQLFCLAQALIKGVSVDHIHNLSKIDKWFLSKLQRMTDIRGEIARRKTLGAVDAYLLRDAKQAGFSDKQIAKILGSSNVSELDVRAHRKSFGIVPAVKRIDTLAGEWISKTNYLYMTYNGTASDVKAEKPHMIVVGSGCYRIGSSVEFDWCGVEAVRQLRKRGIPTVMINNNPETVSTDHTVCDRLFFEEISFERVLDIYEAESPIGVILGVGGQLPNNLALPLQRVGCNVMGTSAVDVDRAEDRSKFSTIVDSIGLEQPAWCELTSVEDGIAFAEKVGFPVVVRPSYVLSGAAMRVATSSADLAGFLRSAAEISPDHPVVISKFIEDAMEIDFDGVMNKSKELLAFAVSEHVEHAGVHSGDATHVLPAPHVSGETYERILDAATRIGAALNICGPFNIQFMVKGTSLMVIECNVRASRSLPFVTKTLGVDVIGMAVKAMMGENISAVDCRPASLKLAHTCVKSPMFSFKRLLGSDPVLGVEMASTGEVGCIGSDHLDALLKSLQATNIPIPKPGANIVVLAESPESRSAFGTAAKQLADLGYSVHVADGENSRAIDDLIRDRKVSLALSFASRHAADQSDNEFTALRRTVVDFAVPTILNIQVAQWLVEALLADRHHSLQYTTTLQQYNGL